VVSFYSYCSTKKKQQKSKKKSSGRTVECQTAKPRFQTSNTKFNVQYNTIQDVGHGIHGILPHLPGISKLLFKHAQKVWLNLTPLANFLRVAWCQKYVFFASYFTEQGYSRYKELREMLFWIRTCCHVFCKKKERKKNNP